MLFDKLLGIVTVAIFSLVLARMLTVEEYAKWSLIATYTGLIVLFARGGLDTHILANSINTKNDRIVEFIQMKLLMLVPISITVYLFLTNKSRLLFLTVFLIPFETLSIYNSVNGSPIFASFFCGMMWIFRLLIDLFVSKKSTLSGVYDLPQVI